MRHFILISHAYLSRGFVSSAELIVGKRENLSYHCAYVDGNDDWKEKVIEEINGFDVDEIVLLTDLFGGSVNNELLELTERDGVYLVSGVNLALVIQLLLYADSEEPFDQVISRCIQDARANMCFCNQALESAEDDELEEF